MNEPTGSSKFTQYEKLMNETEMLYHFLIGNGKDIYGRTHEQILSMSNLKLETTHNYIQWLFPIDTPSKYAASVILTEEMAEQFKEDKRIIDNLRRAYVRMMKFYGFGRDDRGQLVPVVSQWKMRITWLNRGNHNFLRLTRMLKSLHLFRLSDLESELFSALKVLAEDYDFLSVPYGYWENAVTVIE